MEIFGKKAYRPFLRSSTALEKKGFQEPVLVHLFYFLIHP